MRLKSLLLLGGFALAAFQCLAEYSVTVPPGVYYLLANQLDHVGSGGAIDNSITAILPSVPENTTLYLSQYFPAGCYYCADNFSVDNPGWTVPNSQFKPGEPRFIILDHTVVSEPYTITFTGNTPITAYPARS